MNNNQHIDTYFRKNALGIAGAEFLWGLGLPVIIESTFLQLFLKEMGASSLAIGLIPAFFFAGSSLFALLSSYLTSHLEYKRKAVIILHAVSSVSILFFGCCLYLFGETGSMLPVFFISYAVFSICVGMTIPVWLNFLIRLFSEEKSVQGLSVMMISQNSARLISSLCIVKIVEEYSFSLHSSALMFLGVGLVFSLGSLFFFVTREQSVESGDIQQKEESFFKHTIESIRHILKNKNFLFFLGGDLNFFIVVTVVSFYANYATTYCDIDPATAAGMFVAMIYCGSITVNILLGTLGFLSLKNKFIFSKFLSLSGMLLLVLFNTYWTFLLASFLLGTSRGTRMIILSPSVNKLSGLRDSTSYFAVAPLLTLPFCVTLPLVYGKFLDHFSWLQGNSYKILFIISAILIFFTLLSSIKTDFSGKSGQQ
ncbi:MAG: MFS transporter [bacterium]|nr:MFS transporter [bacterium]